MFETEITRARMADHDQTLAVLRRHGHHVQHRASRLAPVRAALAAGVVHLRGIHLHRPARVTTVVHQTRLSH